MSFDHKLLLQYPNTYLNTLFPGNLDSSIVASFWTKVNTKRCGQVFYHSYTIHEIGGQSYLDRATEDVRLYAGLASNRLDTQFNGFIARWVLVATWDKVCIFPSYSHVRINVV